MVNTEAITIEECLELYRHKGYAAVINDGEIITFVYERK